jgi:hypothetical protein
MVPFELRIPLLSPVSLNARWICLDAIVAHLVQLALRGREYYYLPTKQVVRFSGDHRYTRVLKYTPDGLAHASASVWERDGGLHSVGYYKRLEVDRFPARRKVSRGSGHFRDWMLRTVYVPARAVRFYGVGDIELLWELLELLTHVGNDVRIGWGLVDRSGITIRELDEDCSLVWGGVAMRPIPVRFARRWSDAVMLPWRSPYWARESVELCVPPGAEVEL